MKSDELIFCNLLINKQTVIKEFLTDRFILKTNQANPSTRYASALATSAKHELFGHFLTDCKYLPNQSSYRNYHMILSLASNARLSEPNLERTT